MPLKSITISYEPLEIMSSLVCHQFKFPVLYVIAVGVQRNGVKIDPVSARVAPDPDLTSGQARLPP